MIYKIGSTVTIILDSFTDAEWSNIVGYDNIFCEAEMKRPDGSDQEFTFTAVVDEPTRSITLTSVTTDSWPAGEYNLDVRISKGGRYFYYPPQTFITFKLIRPVTDNPVV